VAVNGACLTATSVGDGGFEADVMHQTLSLTTLGDLGASSPVNLELPLRPTDRLGGHVVQGHVDGTATVSDLSADGFAKRLRIELPDELLPYVVERGSIAIEGVSLTIADIADSEVAVSLIPETLERTTLGALESGESVNVECDVLARYVRRQLSADAGLSPLGTEQE
jgi:riboflavin synthase